MLTDLPIQHMFSDLGLMDAETAGLTPSQDLLTGNLNNLTYDELSQAIRNDPVLYQNSEISFISMTIRLREYVNGYWTNFNLQVKQDGTLLNFILSVETIDFSLNAGDFLRSPSFSLLDAQ